jgi:cholinesterase
MVHAEVFDKVRLLKIKCSFALLLGLTGGVAFLCLFAALAIVAPSISSSVERLYVFGDSYSDIGAGYVDGDGPTAVAYLANRLGFSLVPPNASDTAGNTSESLDFAVSGAGTGSASAHRTNGVLLGLGMRDQVEDFAQRVRSGAVKFDPGSTLFFIAGGQNDVFLATGATVENLKSELRILHKLGGRRFMIALLPTSIAASKEVNQRLNPALARIPQEMAAEMSDASVSLSRWGLYFDDVMLDPAKHGIENTIDACAGRAIFNEDPRPCAKPASYFYYHSGHPSTAVHKIVGAKLYEEVLKLPSPRRR